MYKYQFLRNGQAVNIYDYIIVCATCDGKRRVKVEAETYAQAETYAKNIIANLEPWLDTQEEIIPICTERVYLKMI